MESRRMRSRSQILKWVCYAVALFVCAAVGMLALELLLLCFALSVLVQLYLQGSTWNFALISTGTALVVLSLDWLFFYYMPGYSWAQSRWLTFVLPSAMMTLVPSLVLFSLVRRIYNEFKIDNGVI